MSTDRLQAFEAYRTRMNKRILGVKSHRGAKRFFSPDAAAYPDGALDGRTKELLGLGASRVTKHATRPCT